MWRWYRENIARSKKVNVVFVIIFLGVSGMYCLGIASIVAVPRLNADSQVELGTATPATPTETKVAKTSSPLPVATSKPKASPTDIPALEVDDTPTLVIEKTPTPRDTPIAVVTQAPTKTTATTPVPSGTVASTPVVTKAPVTSTPAPSNAVTKTVVATQTAQKTQTPQSQP